MFTLTDVTQDPPVVLYEGPVEPQYDRGTWECGVIRFTDLLKVFVPGGEAEPDATTWLIDTGPFFDRFGAAKMAVLTSSNSTVKAIVQDVMVRKWIDLKRPDVEAGIDALIALGVTGVTSELKNDILNTPVNEDENSALKKVYFS